MPPESCIFSDKEIKNAVHKSLIDTAIFTGKQVEILDSLKLYTKELNDNASMHSQHLEKIERHMSLMVKYFLPAFAIVSIIAFIAVGGGNALDKAMQIFSKIK